MMPLQQKRHTLIIFSASVLAICALFLAIMWKLTQHQEPNFEKPAPPKTTTSTVTSTNETIILAPYNELISSTSNGQVIKNTKCNFTFKIPLGWSVDGLFGGSTIRSREDQNTNEEWNKTHQDLILNAEGDAPLGPNARRFTLGCEDNIDVYKNGMPGLIQFDDFKNAKSLAEVVTSSAFHSKDIDLSLIKIIKIDGIDAYETAETSKGGDGITRTLYEILLENEKIYHIGLDFTEYDKLSDTEKQIIQSISFEK